MTADRLREWLKAQGWTQTRLAREIGTSLALITYIVRKERAPSAFMRDAIERVTDGAIKATDWAKDAETSVSRDETSPESTERPAMVSTKLGSTPDELRASIQGIDQDLLDKELTPPQRTALRKARVAALASLARLERSAELHAHPDFDAHLLDVMTAVERTLEQHGVSPNGARTVFAKLYAELEEQRARRAA